MSVGFTAGEGVEFAESRFAGVSLKIFVAILQRHLKLNGILICNFYIGRISIEILIYDFSDAKCESVLQQGL